MCETHPALLHFIYIDFGNRYGMVFDLDCETYREDEFMSALLTQISSL